ncbi:hypothetical protein BH09SUM1_BH09SUM1_10250 [soil metagenome]
MKISSYAVARPITTLMLFVSIMVLGIVSYRQLSVQLLPDIDFPTIVIIARRERSTNENLEDLTKKLEGIASEMAHVKEVTSNTNATTSRVKIDFDYGSDLQYSTVDLEERLVTFRRQLNDRRTWINAFPWSTSDFQSTLMFLSVRGSGDSSDLFKNVSEKVEQQLRSISGISNVQMRGVDGDAVRVDMKPDLLASYGLDFGAVIQKVQAAASDDNYLGRLRTPRETYFARLDGRVRTAEELADVFVDGKGVVRLRDVAEIEKGRAAAERISRTNGKKSINIRLERESGRNMIDLAKTVRTRVAEINAQLPQGVVLDIDEDLALYVEKAIGKVKKLALQGALLALFVPLIFFRSVRIAAIVLLSLPICLISVFNLFYAAGLTINIFSIMGLALGVGMLVDNSIVVVENSLRLHELGRPSDEAAAQGGEEVARGLLAGTLTSCAVFAPFLFLGDGQFKLFVKEPALALVFPLMLSLLVALTLVPVLIRIALQNAPVTKRRGARRSWIHIAFASILKSALRHRGRVVALVTVMVLVTTLESCRRIRASSTSQDSNGQWMSVYFQTARGSLLSDVNGVAQIIEKRLALHPDIKRFSVSFDTDGGDVSISMKDPSDRETKHTMREIQRGIVDFIGPVPGAEVSLQGFDDPLAQPTINLGTEGSLQLKGLDMAVLHPYADRLIDALRNHPLITNAKVKAERTDAMYLALFDREKAGAFDIKADQLARFVGATRSNGTISSLQLVDGERHTDVSFTISDAAGGTVEDVKEMTMYSRLAGKAPLGDLAKFQTSQSTSSLERADRQSSLQISYYFAPKTNTTELSADIRNIISSLPNPGGISAELSGEAKQIDQRSHDAIFVLATGMALVYVVMATVFESFWIPFIIILTNPLMLIGIIWSLDFAGLPFDDMATFGVILLVGLAVNNGIVMMDRALDMQRRGYGRTRAVFEASVTRLRPIFMTYMTTTLGLLPMALVGDEGDQWRSMAVTIIGGLTSATLLTLVVLPCFYLIGDDLMTWARRPFYNLVRVVFEVVEGVPNAIIHPVRVIRGEQKIAPGVRPFLGASFSLALQLLRTPLRLLWRFPADMIFLFGFLLGKKPVAHPHGRLRGERASANTGGAPPLVSLSNIQVIFPPTGWRAVVDKLPIKLRPARFRRELGVHALNAVHLQMERGLFGLLGPNGAGKTTMLRAIAGLLEPTRGTVRLSGVSHREAPAQLAPLIGYLPQNHGHYDWMTLYEYLEFFAMLTAQTLQKAQAVEPADSPLQSQLARLSALQNPDTRRDAILAAVNEVNLNGALHQRIGSFSGGMKQRAGIARVLLQAPPIIIVDEPTAGLDPVERVKVRLLLSRLAETRLVIFSTHIVEDLDQSCNAVAILNRGRLVFHGSPAELRQQWAGKFWEVLPQESEGIEDLRTRVVAAGGQVLFQVLRNGREALRILSTNSPATNALSVEPTLEDALLAVLGGSRPLR